MGDGGIVDLWPWWHNVNRSIGRQLGAVYGLQEWFASVWDFRSQKSGQVYANTNRTNRSTDKNKRD